MFCPRLQVAQFRLLIYRSRDGDLGTDSEFSEGKLGTGDLFPVPNSPWN